MKKILMATAALMLMMTMPMLTSCTIEDNPAPTTDYGQWNVPETDMDMISICTVTVATGTAQ